MTFRTTRIDDASLFRWGLGLTGSLMGAGIPACLYTLTMVGPAQRVYIAVLSSLLIVMVAALLLGAVRETLRMVRHAQVLFRATRRPRVAGASTEPQGAEPLPA